ncbi:hypothetical protein TRFO_37268 [Tritrichomonas foetus]|uniref:Uncharacterized protein n=1 Tax=Tritrichomonas foetus TaxID=1144522 RepID=A0A1J4JBP0_9EUKA|nr:hypothetical protein TRFO_37268 [Tritrichomonas foetus]|eukprot:OHS96560.1 hypothetical protein TRFO_37268 [Tritrichomonas foetus]
MDENCGYDGKAGNEIAAKSGFPHFGLESKPKLNLPDVPLIQMNLFLKNEYLLAIIENNIEKVKFILSRYNVRYDPNKYMKEYIKMNNPDKLLDTVTLTTSPLKLAIEKGKYDIVKLILQNPYVKIDNSPYLATIVTYTEPPSYCSTFHPYRTLFDDAEFEITLILMRNPNTRREALNILQRYHSTPFWSQASLTDVYNIILDEYNPEK